jgi:putative polyhydroxyalkanoate system protein
MAKTVRVSQPHHTTQDEAMQKLRTMSAQLGSKYGVRVSETGNGASFKGKGVTGTCVIDASNVTLDLSLGMLLRPISGRIEAGIKSKLSEHFGG